MEDGHGQLARTGSRAIGDLRRDLADYAEAAHAPSTRRAYRTALRQFAAWCEANAFEPMPARPETVALFITALAADGKKVSTVEKAVAAISRAHQHQGHASPTRHAYVREVMKGIRRTHGVAPDQKAPVVVEDLRTLVRHLPDSLLGLRDQALLTLGFAGAFRRAALVGLDLDDIEQVDDGLRTLIRKDKTDQEGRGRVVGVPFGGHRETCPVRSVLAWIEAADLNTGPLFRPVDRHGRVKPTRLSAKAVGLVVKRAAEAAGLDADQLGGHSLRSGFVTAAVRAGKSEAAIMRQTGHRSTTVLRGYIRNASVFDDNPAAGIGL